MQAFTATESGFSFPFTVYSKSTCSNCLLDRRGLNINLPLASWSPDSVHRIMLLGAAGPRRWLKVSSPEAGSGVGCKDAGGVIRRPLQIPTPMNQGPC